MAQGSKDTSSETGTTWTVMAALDWTRDYLQRNGDEHARHSAEWLLEAATGLSRLELYTHFDQPLTPDERTHLRDGVARRGAGEPLQYITGIAYFRHLALAVTPAVLIPRPETEVLVDLALQELTEDKPEASEPKILDLCTGSGCIALALTCEAGVSVTATDLSAEALAVARNNAESLGYADRLDLRQGDLFEALGPDERFDLIVSNPPYVPESERATMPPEVADFEPAVALFSGVEGLDVFRRIIEDAPRHLAANGVIIMELHAGNATRAAQEAVKLERYEAIDVLPDLAGRERFVRLRRNASD
ncbi:MAG: peptide chain release factor N(5)-glutamine methyltransferase [Coriobacteriia bacterium]|nr:peptide chain release factor N(5)-glutamine methyltransferase [Coriobacteriia bacterium]